jgi:hypothetical protein
MGHGERDSARLYECQLRDEAPVESRGKVPDRRVMVTGLWPSEADCNLQY